ncbi:hypothetical protein R3W88_004784 [Solanum pinnatisectum]|uniref:Aquaporin NIP-type n=1 Tax=Solanum pinnatisectum TaxID=50273 RepID=A0AAV9KAR3_9SOLN|nr:hypothetical protein R3W88_004784 [Solanum pinnatisectum]
MATNIEEGINICMSQSNNSSTRFCSSPSVVTVAQKLIAEVIGTYFIIFAGCGSVAVNKLYDGSITFPGICVTWGLIVMAPFYIIAQLTGSILASGTLTLLLDVTSKSYFGTIPIGSNAQSLAIEIIISFLLMFVVCGVCTDDRAIGHLGGLAIGMTIILNVFVAGPISGASMNPARSIGPAIVKQVCKGLWVYIVGPLIGTVARAFVYNLIRSTDKPISATS